MAIVTDDIEIEEAAAEDAGLWEFVPEELRQLENQQTAIPRLAKDAGQMRVIEACVQRVPTRHGDARQMGDGWPVLDQGKHRGFTKRSKPGHSANLKQALDTM